jgi:hypothetical protein
MVFIVLSWFLFVACCHRWGPKKKKQRRKQQGKQASDSIGPLRRSIRLASLHVPNMADQDSDDMHSPFLDYKYIADHESYERYGVQMQSAKHESKFLFQRSSSLAHEVIYNARTYFIKL